MAHYDPVTEKVADVGAEKVLQVLGPLLGGERPLVLKVDRGPAFRSKALEDFLQERGVTLLFSPPRRPE
jgi:transposase InsO family protein